MLSSLFEILSEYSLASVLILLAIISIYAIYYRPIKKAITGRYENSDSYDRESNERRKNDLLSHEFFRNLDLKIGVELPLSKYSDSVNRNILIRDMTLILFTLYREAMYELCKKLDSSLTPEELLTTLTQLHFDILEDFKTHAASEQIPDLATESYRTWFLDNVKIVHYYTSNICKSNIETTTVDRVRTFLFVLQIVLISALNDLQKKPVINGSLNGIKYKDLIIEDDI